MREVSDYMYELCMRRSDALALGLLGAQSRLRKPVGFEDSVVTSAKSSIVIRTLNFTLLNDIEGSRISGSQQSIAQSKYRELVDEQVA